MKLFKIAVCAALALAVFALGACGGKGAQTKEVKLNQDSLSLEIGERKVLELLQDGEPISEGVTWFSSKSEVASVERTTGLVTAVGSGPCVITAAYQEKSYPCNVQVAEEPAYTMSAATLELPEGETATLSLLEDGEPVAERVTWVSSNPAVASVKDGTVTAKKEGETVIGASYQGHEASCAVTVVPPEYVKIVNEAEEITYDGPDTEKKEVRRTLFKKENETFALQCETKDDISLVYSSSDDAVAEIDGAGNVTAKSAGAAVLAAKSAEAGPDGRVYGDEIVLVVSGAVGSARSDSVYQAPLGGARSLRLDLYADGTFSYSRIDGGTLAADSACAGVYAETESAVGLYYPENGGMKRITLESSSGGLASSDILVGGEKISAEFAPCTAAGAYYCRIDVEAMDQTFEFDLTLEEDGSYVYFRRKSEVKEEGVVNEGEWRISDGYLKFDYDGGEMSFRILCNGCVQSVGSIPTGGMETQLTFRIVTER